MRHLFTGLTFLAVTCCLAQVKTIRPEPHWNYLDKRMVTTVGTLKMTIADTTVMESSSKSAYTIAVSDMRKDHYVLTTRVDETDDLIGDLRTQVSGLPQVQRDSVMRRMREVLSAIYEPLMKLEFRFKVDRTGKATELLDEARNQEEIRTAMMDGVKQMLSLAREDKRHTEQEVEARMNHLLDSLSGAFSQVQVNNMNLFLEPYAYDFPVTGSSRQQAMITDVDAPMLDRFGTLPGIMELGLDELTDRTIVARIVTTYDQAALRAAILKDDPDAGKKLKELSLIEESVYTIDRASGWLTRETKEIRLRMDSLRLVVHSASDLGPVK
jgi:hypothetical protein